MQRFDYLFDLFQNAGKVLYLVGGCVRDLLMGKPPKDFDFTTDALPDETRQILRSAKLRAVPVGEAFGTIASSFAGRDIEITTFRVKESYTKGSRHPTVIFGKDLMQDLSRRDLTINAMAFDRHGVIHDPFGGKADLEAGILRAPGGGFEKTQEIFGDDPLRILRVARFMARYGFDTDEATDAAAKAKAAALLSVSRERWQMETLQILQGARIEKAFSWLESVGVLAVYLPEVLNLGPQMLSLTLAVVAGIPAHEPLWRWAGLLHALGPEAAESVCVRLKFSNQHRDLVRSYVERVTVFDPDPDPSHASHASDPAHGMPTRAFCRRLMVELRENLAGFLALVDARAQAHGGALNVRVQASLYVMREHAQALLADFGDWDGLTPTLPTGLGLALIDQAGYPRSPDLRKVMDWLREQVLLERLPNPPTEAHCIQAALYKRQHLSEDPTKDQDLPAGWDA